MQKKILDEVVKLFVYKLNHIYIYIYIYYTMDVNMVT